MTRALLIVDVQNDFTEGGVLGAEGGAKVAAELTTFLKDHAGDYAVIAASRDWHDPDNNNGGHFGSPPDFVDSWPAHCVANTEGAEYHPNLDTSHVQVHVKKGMGVPAYSAFEGVTPEGTTLADALREAGVTELDVTVIATDYCVRASALDALHEGFEVRVLSEFTASIADPTQALNDVREAGGTIA